MKSSASNNIASLIRKAQSFFSILLPRFKMTTCRKNPLRGFVASSKSNERFALSMATIQDNEASNRPSSTTPGFPSPNSRQALVLTPPKLTMEIFIQFMQTYMETI